MAAKPCDLSIRKYQKAPVHHLLDMCTKFRKYILRGFVVKLQKRNVTDGRTEPISISPANFVGWRGITRKRAIRDCRLLCSKVSPHKGSLAQPFLMASPPALTRQPANVVGWQGITTERTTPARNETSRNPQLLASPHALTRGEVNSHPPFSLGKAPSGGKVEPPPTVFAWQSAKWGKGGATPRVKQRMSA